MDEKKEMLPTVSQKNTKLKSNKSNRWYIFGIFILISSIISYYALKWFVIQQVHQNIILRNNSEAFNYWKDPPAIITRKYYLFDIQNPYELQMGVEKPRVVERGPYTYVEKWEKRNIEFLGVEIVRFNPVVSLFFEASLSIGSESDIITVMNVPALGLIEDSIKGNTEKSDVNLINAMSETRLFVQRSVGQLMSGYEDDLLSMAKQFMPDKVKSSTFSYLMGKNATVSDTFSIMTGYSDYNDKGKIIDWNGSKKLDLWESENANLINGTDGTMFAPFMTRDQNIFSFSSDMCRSYHLVFKEDRRIFDINTLGFHLPENLFHNSTSNPFNDGFCEGDCLGNGVQNISKCYGGLSGFISQPHFLNADEKFSEDIIGLESNEDKHETVMYFEPTTGVPIYGNVRFQISFFLPNDDTIELVKNLKPVLMPILWFDESLELDPEIRNKLGQVALIAKFTHVVPILLIFISILLIAFSILICMFKCIKKKIKLYYFFSPVNIFGPSSSSSTENV